MHGIRSIHHVLRHTNVLRIYNTNTPFLCCFNSTTTCASYIRELGDPVLRQRCQIVPKDQIKSTEVQDVIKEIVSTMQQDGGLFGLAAPQIGVPLQIIVLECNKISDEPNLREEMKFPRKIFINPELTVTDSNIVVFKEKCASVSYDVNVPRAYGVEVTGFNEYGNEVRWSVTGWPARILQHEVDHVNGILNIDRRQKLTPMNMIKKWIMWLKGG